MNELRPQVLSLNNTYDVIHQLPKGQCYMLKILASRRLDNVSSIDITFDCFHP